MKLIKFRFFILLLSVTVAVASCNTFDPPIVVPAYGHIDSVHFEITNQPLQGSASATIPAAWVYLDDNPVGAFQLPCTFPLVASNGNHNIKIYPGVSTAGGTSPYNIEPFYQYYSVTANLQQGKTTTFQPVSYYYSWVVFKLMEDFESELVNTQPAHIINFGGDGSVGGGSTTTMTVIGSPSSDVFEGHHSGRVLVNKSHEYYIGMTNPWDSLPNNSTPVYLEANYKCTTYLSVGMFAEDTTLGPITPSVLSSTATWKKLYVTLNPTIQNYYLFPQYRVYFSVRLDTIDGHTTDTLLLDNIKIIY